MNKLIYISILIFGIQSCQKTPSYCENKFKVTKIILTPIDKRWGGGNDTVISNDSLINYISSQICNINTKENDYRTGRQGCAYEIKVNLYDNDELKNNNLIVTFDRFVTKSFLLREGENTFFKNDSLCEIIVNLTGVTVDPKDRK